MEKRGAYIVAYGRSPIAKSNQTGALRYTRPEDVASEVLTGVLKQIPDFNYELIEDVIIGCAFPEGEQGTNLAKIIADRSGLPESVPGQTVNRYCASSLQTIADGASHIKAGHVNCVVAGGVEFMSRIPMGGGAFAPNPSLIKSHPESYMAMGITAENVADQYQISRQEQDEFAVSSHQKAWQAQEQEKFTEIIPVTAYLPDSHNQLVPSEFKKDQGIRPETDQNKLAQLKPAFKLGGSVTAGNSSQTSDGAAMLVLMSGELVEELKLQPIAKFVDFTIVGLDPKIMGVGALKSIESLLAKNNLTPEEIDLFEINEAFASQAVLAVKSLNLPSDKVNVNGGAIALGHPLGATGAILTSKLLAELGRRKEQTGVVSLCIGGGMGAAALIEYL